MEKKNNYEREYWELYDKVFTLLETLGSQHSFMDYKKAITDVRKILDKKNREDVGKVGNGIIKKTYARKKI